MTHSRHGASYLTGVRLDDEADKALRTLESTGLTQSEAIRVALLGEVRHLRRSKELAAEVAALEADEQDREAEKLACYRRTALGRDVYDLAQMASRPIDETLGIRSGSWN